MLSHKSVTCSVFLCSFKIFYLVSHTSNILELLGLCHKSCFIILIFSLRLHLVQWLTNFGVYQNLKEPPQKNIVVEFHSIRKGPESLHFYQDPWLFLLPTKVWEPLLWCLEVKANLALNRKYTISLSIHW